MQANQHMIETQQEMIKENLLRDLTSGSGTGDSTLSPRSGYEQYSKKGIIQRMREELASKRPLFEHSLSHGNYMV